MEEIDIFLLDNLNKAKEEINMIKPSSYQELLELLKQILKIHQNIMRYLF